MPAKLRCRRSGVRRRGLEWRRLGVAAAWREICRERIEGSIRGRSLPESFSIVPFRSWLANARTSTVSPRDPNGHWRSLREVCS